MSQIPEIDPDLRDDEQRCGQCGNVWETVLLTDGVCENCLGKIWKMLAGGMSQQQLGTAICWDAETMRQHYELATRAESGE